MGYSRGFADLPEEALRAGLLRNGDLIPLMSMVAAALRSINSN